MGEGKSEFKRLLLGLNLKMEGDRSVVRLQVVAGPCNHRSQFLGPGPHSNLPLSTASSPSSKMSTTWPSRTARQRGQQDQAPSAAVAPSPRPDRRLGTPTP